MANAPPSVGDLFKMLEASSRAVADEITTGGFRDTMVRTVLPPAGKR